MIIKDDVLFGLTPEEVEERIKKGQVNKKESRKTKSYREIFLNNLLSVFNLVILVMTILVIPTIKKIGDVSNIVFVLIAFLNLLIGIIQEIKAKRIVDKLVLVNESKVKVLRNLSTEEIEISNIVLDDIMILEANKQISADSIVLSGEMYVNESNITGESDDILKKKGDELYSGSYVVSGECYAKVIHVGKDNFIEKLSSQATKYSKPNSEIMNSLNKVITIISISLIPLSILLYFVYRGYSNYVSDNFVIFNLSRELVLGLVSAINGMIPYGLFLLTSVSLAASVIKLARSKTVVQELYCIEQLARVDTLCLDKTGTITDGTMRVEELILVNPKYQALEIISSMNGTLKGSNQTSIALKDRFGDNVYFSATQILNFNSTNKFSAVSFKEVGTFALGAPDILVKLKKNDPYQKLITSRAMSGTRVLALCKTQSKIKDNKLAGPFELIALIAIHDNIREGAKETIKEFIDNGVDIKIISGDNPMTVSAIARDAGVLNYDKWISLDDLSDEEVIEASKEYTVFGRVKPHQKKLIVQTLKKEGHKVAMTGDGVNDILALRESDCSIAMASGSEAVKTVAHLVLLDSNFLSLPKVVTEGRRVINNIERSASLFLSKTFLMIFINITAIVLYFIHPELEFTSPFRQPSQLIIIETFIIGIPSLVLALEPNGQIISGKFLSNIFKGAFPGALIVFLDLLLVRFLSPLFGFSDLVETNISLLASTYAFFMVLIYISIPYSKLRMWVSIITAIIISFCPLVSIYTLETFGADFFHYGFDGYKFVMEPSAYLMTVSLIFGSMLMYALFLLLKINKIRGYKK
ncbi:HAD-IC family P-type ATPase [bacterium]|nr:HAD-IC family P-type ATPase [bacterium]